MPAFEVDVLLGPNFDMSKPKLIKLLCQMVSEQRFLAVMIAVPCGTFSRARRAPRGSCMPSALRSSSEPWGLSDLSPDEQSKVDDANRITRNTLKVIRCLVRNGIPFILENPLGSIIWLLPEMVALSKRIDVSIVVTHFCQWGVKWMKPTKLLCFNLDADETSTLQRLCCRRKGLCSKSGLPHPPLSGTNKEGHFWTRLAQPYPHELAAELAHVLASGGRYRWLTRGTRSAKDSGLGLPLAVFGSDSGPRLPQQSVCDASV